MNQKTRIENLFNYLQADDSATLNGIKLDISKLQADVNSWGETGAFLKSHAEKKAGTRILEIKQNYQNSLNQRLTDIQKEIAANSERRKDKIKMNSTYEIVKQQEEDFRASLLSDDEIRMKLAEATKSDADETAVVSAFAGGGYAEVKAIHKQLAARGLPIKEALEKKIRDISPLYFDDLDSLRLHQEAKEIKSIPFGHARVKRPETNEYMNVEIDRLIETDAPLKNLAS